MKGLRYSFASASVGDLDAAKEFYTNTLGLGIDMDQDGVVILKAGGDTQIMIYAKDDHQPASHTVLNFVVENIEATMAELAEKGVSFEHIEGTDENGVTTMGPIKMAWFKDPADNWISLTENSSES